MTLYPADVVLFEGILMFYSQEIRDLFQMKLFVDTDPDTRLSRRGTRLRKSVRTQPLIEMQDYHSAEVSPNTLCVCARLCVTVLRDISERGRELEQVLSQYITFVKPAFEEFCLPVSVGILFPIFFFLPSRTPISTCLL